MDCIECGQRLPNGATWKTCEGCEGYAKGYAQAEKNHRESAAESAARSAAMSAAFRDVLLSIARSAYLEKGLDERFPLRST